MIKAITWTSYHAALCNSTSLYTLS